MKKILFLLFAAVTLTSCQFTETMVMNEDGTGRMSLSLDLSEMMAMSGSFGSDSTEVKQDTIISFKDIFKEKKDSIAQLPKAEQKRLKAMENYMIHVLSDPDESKMIVDLFTDFKSVSEANDLLKGFEQTGDIMGDSKDNNGTSEPEPELIGVNYSFDKGKFVRDAYIKDLAKHSSQMDSLKQIESFMSGARYKIKYTFPKRIKATSVEDATFSLDGKTLELERPFLEYFRNPDILDLEVELEN